jgi:hypothetical protein
MNSIDNNPYRILGLPITATEKEIAKQINTLTTYAEMGKAKSLDTDFPFMPPVNRTPPIIEEAKKQIEQSESKLFYSLFWFWKNNSADELALDVLKEGNTNKAIEIWEKPVFSDKHTVYKPVVLFENLVRQSTAWPEEVTEDHLLKKNEDEYIIERRAGENYTIPSILAELNEKDNWSIECDTDWKSGIDNFSYGIVFGREKGSYYFFGIAANGNYMYGKYNDWEFTPCIDWKEAPGINKWSGNHLQVKKIADQLTFYINGKLVDSFQGEPFFGNFFGFKVSNKQNVTFRNFKFCKLEESDAYGEGINAGPKNASNIKNLSTLYLGLATNNGTFHLDCFKKGIVLAGTFFSTDNITDYSKLIAGERYLYNPEKTIHFFINDVINLVKDHLGKQGGISTSQLINCFSSFPVEARQFLSNRFVAKQVQNIDKEIETAHSERKESGVRALDIGKRLTDNTKADILFLKAALGENDFQYQISADKLSSAIVQCGIEYYNATKNDEAYLPLYEFAVEVAVTPRAKEKAKENLNSCKEWIANKHLYHCWFCGKNPPQPGSEYSITIYKETSRTHIPRRVQFSYVPVNIPRCNDCKKIHKESSDKIGVAIVLGVVAGGIIGALAGGHWFIGLLIGTFLGWAIGSALKSQHLTKSGVKDTGNTTIRNYPVLNQMLKEGWQFSKPTP